MFEVVDGKVTECEIATLCCLHRPAQIVLALERLCMNVGLHLHVNTMYQLQTSGSQIPLYVVFLKILGGFNIQYFIQV